MPLRIWISSFFFVIYIPLCSQARERREFYNGVRALGMGDVSVVTVNDETALILNPAALGKLRDFYGTIIDPELEVGSRVIDMNRASSISQFTKINSVVPSLLVSPNTWYHYRMQFFPSFVARNFGIGITSNTTMSGQALSPTQVDLFYRNDLSLLLGYNLRLWGGRVKIGFNGKLTSRIELNEATLDPTQSLDDGALGTAGLLREGTGLGADAGIILTAPWTMLPTIGAVLRDVGGTAFDKTSGQRLAAATARPDRVAQDLDVAVSISPIHQNNMRSVWSFEYRGLLTAKDEADKAKLIHFGTEFNFSDILFVRAGYNQRYWTAGIELSSERFQLQIATYGEEVGTQDTTKEDRRVVAKASFRF
jgi:hypothetical protein